MAPATRGPELIECPMQSRPTVLPWMQTITAVHLPDPMQGSTRIPLPALAAPTVPPPFIVLAAVEGSMEVGADVETQ